MKLLLLLGAAGGTRQAGAGGGDLTRRSQRPYCHPMLTQGYHGLRAGGARQSRHRLIRSLALAALGAACAPADPDAGTGPSGLQTVREIRGDTLIVRTTGMDSIGARIQLAHEFSIGGREGAPAELLVSIGLVQPFADGGVLFSDGSRASTRVLHFGPDGRHVRNISRLGEGPGEFINVAGLAVADDSRILIWSLSGAAGPSVSVFDSAGKHLTTWEAPFPIGRFVDAQGRAYSEGSINDPELPDSVVPPAGRRVQRKTVARTELDGTVIDSIVAPRALRSVPAFVLPRGAKEGAFMTLLPLPFIPQFMSAVSPLGYFVSTSADTYAISLRSSDGKPMLINGDRRPAVLSDQERQDNYNRLRTRTDAVHLSDIPASKPFFRGLRVDSDGRIWVWLHKPSMKVAFPDSTPVADGAPRHRWVEESGYDVFSPDGQFLGTATLPEKATFAAARGNILWLVITDELDVPKLARFGLSFPSPPWLKSPGRTLTTS